MHVPRKCSETRVHGCQSLTRQTLAFPGHFVAVLPLLSPNKPTFTGVACWGSWSKSQPHSRTPEGPLEKLTRH